MSFIDQFWHVFGWTSKHLPEEKRESLSKELKEARLDCSAREWFSVAVGVSAIIVVLCPSLLIHFLSLSHSLASSLVLGVVSGVLTYHYPHAKKKWVAQELEKDLPTTLRLMATQLNTGIPFKKALENSRPEKGLLSKELGNCLKQNKPLTKSLEELGRKTSSKTMKRTVMQLILTYEKGGQQNLKKLANELVQKQKNQIKEYSGKAMIYSLLFISLSAILPALFQAYVILGSFFMSKTVSPLQALLIPAMVFPAINVIVLGVIHHKKPVYLKE